LANTAGDRSDSDFTLNTLGIFAANRLSTNAVVRHVHFIAIGADDGLAFETVEPAAAAGSVQRQRKITIAMTDLNIQRVE
jgi:hypothetical protein